jgi:hypothetical protein
LPCSVVRQDRPRQGRRQSGADDYTATIKGDRQANEEGVSALSRQKSIKLEDSDTDKVEKAI